MSSIYNQFPVKIVLIVGNLEAVLAETLSGFILFLNRDDKTISDYIANLNKTIAKKRMKTLGFFGAPSPVLTRE